jgi:hypothetical protein
LEKEKTNTKNNETDFKRIEYEIMDPFSFMLNEPMERCHEGLSNSFLGALLWCLDLWSINLLGWSSVLLDLGSFGLLSLHLLEVSVLKIFLGGFEIGISDLSIFTSLSLDLIKGHTDDSLLDSCSSSGSLLLEFTDSGLLVESTGSLGPGQLDWLNLLVEQTSCLGGEEEMDLTISSSEFGSSTGIDFVFSKYAGISLNNHLSDLYIKLIIKYTAKIAIKSTQHT